MSLSPEITGEGGILRGRGTRACVLLLGAVAAWPASALAKPVSFPHGTVDQRFTTKKPNSPTGSSFTGRYHAAGDPDAYPPYMRKMTFYLPRGMRYDTSVPERCTASDLELALSAGGACPPGSRLASGKADGLFMDRSPSTIDVDVFNNEGEQIMVARTPFLVTLIRGRMSPDGSSITFASPTCYPSTPAGCPVDNVRQLGSSVAMPPHSRVVDGRVRSYLTTPATCPRSGRWRTVIRFWWDDGSVDRVVTRHPCKRSGAQRRRSSR
jgi:hypothetical protein